MNKTFKELISGSAISESKKKIRKMGKAKFKARILKRKKFKLKTMNVKMQKALLDTKRGIK